MQPRPPAGTPVPASHRLAPCLSPQNQSGNLLWFHRTYAVGVVMGGLEGRVPSGCLSKNLFLWAACGGFAAARGPQQRISGAASPPPNPHHVSHVISYEKGQLHEQFGTV